MGQLEKTPIPILCVTTAELQAVAQAQQQQLLTTEQIEQLILRLRETLQNNPLWQAQLKSCVAEILLFDTYERWLQVVGDYLWTRADIGVEDVDTSTADFYALFLNGTGPEQAATAVLSEVSNEQ